MRIELHEKGRHPVNSSWSSAPHPNRFVNKKQISIQTDCATGSSVQTDFRIYCSGLAGFGFGLSLFLPDKPLSFAYNGWPLHGTAPGE
jgi:hypothetical protein